ncbi:MAG: MgtC/SapB family protein [archaeon]
MAELVILLKFLLALVLGALIGAERERFAKVRDGFLFGGIRTFMIIALMGAIAAYVGELYSDWLIVPIFFGLVVLIGVSYYVSATESKGQSIGLTAEIAALAVFLLGIISYKGEPIFAVVLGIIIATLLYMKESMHKLVKQVSREEMFGTLAFAIIVFLVLPFLPNQTFGPLDVLNPFKIWLMVVFISGLGYVGYIMIKVLGSKIGIGLTGLLGGLVSSTAVTMNFAGQSKKEKNVKIVRLFVFATLLANAVMFLRVIIEVYVVNKSILSELLVPMIIMFVVSLGCALWLWMSRGNSTVSNETSVEHKSPFTIGPALKFGILFGVVLFVIKLAEVYFGDTGLYIASIVSGFVDVDAITLSMANLAGDTITEKVAATAITLAVMSNTIIKFGYAAIFGSKEFKKKLGISFVLIVVAGLLAIWLL